MQLNNYINEFYISEINIAKLEAIKLEGDDLDGYKVNCLKCGSESTYHPFQVSVKCKFCTTETPVYDICMSLTGLSCQQFVSLLESYKKKPIPTHIKAQYLPHNPVLLEKSVKSLSGPAWEIMKHIGLAAKKYEHNPFVVVRDPKAYKNLDNVSVDKHCTYGSLCLVWHTKNGIHLTHALKPSLPVNEPPAFLHSAIEKVKNGKKHLFVASPFIAAALNLKGEASISLPSKISPNEISNTIRLIKPSMCVFINPKKALMEQLTESEETLLTAVKIKEPGLTKNSLERIFHRLSENKMQDLEFYTHRQKTIFDLISGYVTKNTPAYVIRDLVKEVCGLDVIIKKRN